MKSQKAGYQFFTGHKNQFHAQYLNNQFKKEWLSKLPPSLMMDNAESVRVYFNQHYFPQKISSGSAFSLHRLLTKTAAISVEGDRVGHFQDGTPFPDAYFFSRLKPGAPEGLAPQERLLAAKKVITSTSSVLVVGGYPYHYPRKNLDNPFQAGVISLVGSQFENTYLQYRMFMMDPHQRHIEPGLFAHLYNDTPKDYESAQQALKNYDRNDDLQRLRHGLFFIARNSSGYFYTTPFKKNAIIFHHTAYLNGQIEDLFLSLASANQMAEEAGKPAYLKATAVGMGFFARIDGVYDIGAYLFPLYLQAFKHVLENHAFPNIKCIEFPIFEEQRQNNFKSVFGNQTTINGIEVRQNSLDVLAFSDKQKEQYYPCVLNPSDSNAFSGNEWGYGSVESAIGNNTTIRMDQVYLTNPHLTAPEKHIGIAMESHDFKYQSFNSGMK